MLTFQGQCSINTLVPQGNHTGPLGWTHVSDGVILPFGEVDCDGVRKFVRGGLLTLRPAARLTAYGRALGRVVAHELFHIFADTKDHGINGVAKEAYTVQDLLSPELHFHQRESNVLRTSKTHTMLENAVSGDSSR